MNFLELVKKRYSCKSYGSRPVEEEKLLRILEAGRLAPTAKNSQEQRVYVIQSEEGLNKIDELTSCRYGALTVLLVCYDKSGAYMYPGDKKDSGAEDASIVATHMMLAASSEGIDSCWVNRFDPESAIKLLGLPENEEPVMLLDLGYAAEGAGPLPNHESRKEIRETVSYI